MTLHNDHICYLEFQVKVDIVVIKQGLASQVNILILCSSDCVPHCDVVSVFCLVDQPCSELELTWQLDCKLALQ